MLDQVFSYANSDHAAPAAAAPDQKPANDQAPAEPKPFAAFEQKAAPKGAPEAVVPEKVRELRAAGASFYGPGFDDAKIDGLLRIGADTDGNPIPEETQRQAAHEMKLILGDVGMSAPEGREFVALTAKLISEPPSVETEKEWSAEAWRALVRTHGENGATEALEDARRLVQRDPRLAQVLDITRAGSHPRVVATLVEKARSEKAKGRL